MFDATFTAMLEQIFNLEEDFKWRKLSLFNYNFKTLVDTWFPRMCSAFFKK